MRLLRCPRTDSAVSRVYLDGIYETALCYISHGVSFVKRQGVCALSRGSGTPFLTSTAPVLVALLATKAALKFTHYLRETSLLKCVGDLSGIRENGSSRKVLEVPSDLL